MLMDHNDMGGGGEESHRDTGLGGAVKGLLRGFAWRLSLMVIGVAFLVFIYFIPRITAHILTTRGGAPFHVGSRADGVFLRNLLFCGSGSGLFPDRLDDYVFRNVNPTIFQTDDAVAPLCSKDFSSFFGSLDLSKYLPDGGASLARIKSGGSAVDANQQHQNKDNTPPDILSQMMQECSVDSIIEIPPNTPEDDALDDAVSKLSEGFESTTTKKDDHYSARALNALWKKIVFNSFVSDRCDGVRSLRSVFSRHARQF